MYSHEGKIYIEVLFCELWLYKVTTEGFYHSISRPFGSLHLTAQFEEPELLDRYHSAWDQSVGTQLVLRV